MFPLILTDLRGYSSGYEQLGVLGSQVNCRDFGIGVD